MQETLACGQWCVGWRAMKEEVMHCRIGVNGCVQVPHWISILPVAAHGIISEI